MRTDVELMLAFQAGERAAFDALFERYRVPVWAFFRRRVAESADAEELVQETFLAVLRGAVRYEPRAEFRSYLFGIAFNLVQARRRAGLRAGTDVDQPAVDRAAAPEADPVSALWVRQALASLDAADREIVMLREFDALSYADIAALLDIPLNTVRSRLFRARAALRGKLAGDVAPGKPGPSGPREVRA